MRKDRVTMGSFKVHIWENIQSKHLLKINILFFKLKMLSHLFYTEKYSLKLKCKGKQFIDPFELKKILSMCLIPYTFTSVI